MHQNQWKLGQLLIDGGFICADELRLALAEQADTHLPVGEILCQQGVLREDDLEIVLRLQETLRTLSAAPGANAPATDAAPVRAAAHVRLGELLVAHGDITVSQLNDALQAQRMTGRRLGDVLTETGAVAQTTVGRFLRLQSRLMAAAFGAALAFGAAAAPAPSQPGAAKLIALAPSASPESHRHLAASHLGEFPDLRQSRSAELQSALDNSLAELGLTSAVRNKQLAVALVDVTDVRNPHMAATNGDNMMYAASLPKIGILLGAMQRVEDGELQLDDATRAQLTRMIRRSSNRAATAMYYTVGPEYLSEVLQEYGLYDTRYDGGLWVGKPYGKGAAWKRDPMHGLAHGATAIQVARFLYMMETGQLASPELSAEMKNIMGDPAINHKFVKGLNTYRPGSKIFRKSGTWRTYHADCALVERDGRKYIAVGLANSSDGSAWLSKLIVKLDDIIFEQVPTPVHVAALK